MLRWWQQVNTVQGPGSKALTNANLASGPVYLFTSTYNLNLRLSVSAPETEKLFIG